MKRIIAMLLAIIMLAGSVPVQAFATEGQTETSACATPDCTYAAGHEGNCSNYVAPEEPDQTPAACENTGCEYEAGHEGRCSNYVEPAKDAAVYVTVSDRGELDMAYEEVTVSDINQDGKLSVDEALQATHTVYGKGYASTNGTVTKLWDVETTNVSFFVNHEPISTDVSAETIREGDYLVASVDQDALNDYDKYSRFHVLEKSADGGKEFILTLVDNEGTALAGMEIGLWSGNGSTIMLSQFTDENGQAALTLDQEGIYCVTAKGTLVEQSYNLETEEYTSIETPIIAPVCLVTVSGNAVRDAEPAPVAKTSRQAKTMLANAPSTVAEGETELSVSGGTITVASGTTAGPATLTTLDVYTQGDFKAVSIVSATQNGNTIDVILSDSTDPAAKLQAGFGTGTSGARITYLNNSNKCTLSGGSGTMAMQFNVFLGQNTGPYNFTVNFTIPMGTAYTVTPPTGEGFTFTGKDSVYEGEDYTFSLAVNEGYDSTNMVVKVNDQEVTGDNGTYTVPSVSGDLTITVEGIVKKELCTVTLTEGEGYIISSEDVSYKGEDYSFTVTADGVNYKADTLVVLLDSEPITGTDGTYTISALDKDHVVTVTIEKKAEYTVTKTTMDGVTITGEDKVLETDPYTFTVTVDNAYDVSGMVVTVNGEEINLNADGRYTIAAVSENIAVAVTGVEKKTVYAVTLTEGEGYTISGQATSYAGEPYTFTVTVDDAIYFADQIQVKVNNVEVDLDENGQYTIEALSGDTEVTVENVVERTLFTVTKPEVEGVTFTGGENVREGKPYTFSISVDDSYDTAAMVVTINNVVVSLTNGSYTVESVAEDLVISVTGVEKKQVCNITLPTGKGYTVSGDLTAYKGATYTFTVRPTTGYTDANMVVTANGETVNGTAGSYTINVAGDTIIEVTGVEREALPETELPVSGNVVDITDRNIYSISKYYAKATNIAITGAKVKKAYENGTAVYIFVSSDTPDDAQVDISFGTALNRCTANGTTGSLSLTEGEGTIQMTLTGYYVSSMKGTVTYNLLFFREEAATEIPVCIQGTDSAEMYRGRSITLNLETYFTGAETYYLVQSAGNTTVSEDYTFTPDAAGTHTLVFGAANPVGDCPDHVTVTITVKDIDGGIWIGHTTSSGSMNFVQFYDETGALIQGLSATLDGRNIHVVLPKNYSPTGKVKAVFDLTRNNGDFPFITTSTETSGTSSSQATGQKFTEKITTLSAGEGKFTFYYYNQNHQEKKYDTFTLSYTIANDLPILADSISATAAATITAGDNYTLDLTPLFTDADGDPMTYLVSIDGAAAVAADAAYSYTNNVAGTYTLVFTANDGKGTSTASYTVTLTVENTTATNSMTVVLPEGLEPKFYASTGFGTDGTDTQGDEILAVKGETGYILSYPANVETISIREKNWGGMTFPAEADTTVTLRQVQMSVVDYDNNPAESTNTVTYDSHKAFPGTEGWLLVTGQEYTFAAVPKDTSLGSVSMVEMVQPGEGVHTVNVVLGISNPIAITVPNAATARLYSYDTGKYYKATALAAKIVKDNGNGTTTYSFVGDTKANGSCYIYQVSMPGKITKAGYLNWGQQTLTVTYTDADKSNTYRLDDYSATGEANSSIADDGVMLNINSRNHLSMSVGESKTLKAYRIWEIIKISYQNYIITPEFAYTILSGNDVVSLTEKDSPSAGEGDWMTLTALKEGVAVIEVTYDAMEVTGGSYGGSYGATDPARTGLVVVQVGGSDNTVNFGIDCFASRGISGSNNISYNPNSERAWDAEFDTLYFTDSSGQLKFSPVAGTDITKVEVSNDRGNSWTELEAVEGVYTAPIVSGNNILRVTTLNGTAYQIVRGDKVTAQISEATGDGDNHIEPGETVRVTLNGLHIPIPKMAGNYNPGYYGNSDGFSSIHLNYSVGDQQVYGPGTQYNFITAANYLEIAIPEDWNSNTMTLSDGYIGLGVLGLTTFDTGGDSHRNIPDTGCATRGNETTFHTRSILPEITIPVAGVKVPVAVTGVTLDKKELNLNVGDTQNLTATVSPADADNKEVTWSSENASVATAVNGEVKAIGAGTTVITVTTKDGEKTASCTVTVKQPVQSITVTPAMAEVEVGKTVTLTAEVLPENATDKSVFWTSSDETIATVENGQVTGVKEGTVTITAQAGDKTATCSITIKPVEIPFHSAEVYFSVSHDDQFLKAEKTGAVMALQKLTVPYFDLSQYGLGAFSLPTTHSDCGKPTMLHLYIYATEVLYYGLKPEEAGKGYLAQYLGSDVFAVSGGPGSVCVDQFWGMDMNLNYYHNYIFPAEESGTGITADRVILNDGDIVTIGHFTSWKFFGDPSSIFNYLVADGDTVVTTAAQNDPLALQIYRAGPDLGAGGSNTPVKASWDIYYVKAEQLSSGNVTSWTKLGTTDASGKLTADLSDLPVGRYVLAVAGQYGEKYPKDIVSTPGGIVLNVTENTLPAAVQAVIVKIKAIGNVTLENEQSIADARDAYDKLTDAQKALVTNLQILTAAEQKLAQLKTDKAAGEAVVQLIEDIGEVTLDKEQDIADARNAYDKLTDAQKALVTNFQILNEAEQKLAQLKNDKAASEAVIQMIENIGEVTLEDGQAIADARAAYDALTDTQKALVTNLQILNEAEQKFAQLKIDKAASEAVIQKIESIGEVTLEDEQAISDARAAYDKLTDAQKALVTDSTYKILTDAETTVAHLQAAAADQAAAEAVIDLIEDIGNVSLGSEKAIEAALAAYEALTESQRALVTNYEDLTEAAETLKLLKLDAYIAEMYQTTGKYLSGLEAPGVGNTDGEWRVIGLSRAGRSVPDAYYEAVVDYVKTTIAELKKDDPAIPEGRLHVGKSSDNSRIILALTAIGKDVTDVGGHDLLSGLDNMEYIGNQGVNGYIWALLAFDSHAYPIPAGDVTRDKLVDAILTEQLADGGWALAGNVSDPDMTGMALAALAHYRSDANVAAAVEKALECLSDMQNEDGTFSSVTEGVTCESLAQVVTGLTALGINPKTDRRFIKNNGISAMDAFASFYVEGGGFKHGRTGDRNMMATEQGYYALVSYFRMLNDENPLYDMSDVVLVVSAVKNVENLIEEIGSVITGSSKAKIDTAREAYEALDDTLKPLVKNLTKLQDAEKAYDQLMAEAVMDKIEAIGEADKVTLESEQIIKDAADAYEALTDTQKEYVTNYDKLTAAQKAWADLKSTEADKVKAAEVKALIEAIGQVTLDREAKILEARAAYEELTDVQKPYVDNLETLKTAEKTLQDLKDQKAADDVALLIDQIGQVELTTACENAINAARRAYNELTTIQQGKVDAAHLKTLTDAEKTLGALKDQAAADAVEQKISNIGTNITSASESKIKTARNAYNTLTAAQKALVSNYQTLVKAEEALDALKSTVSVTFSLLGCYKHGTGETSVHTLAGGNLQTWIAAKTYKVKPGATVKDLFEQALTAAGLTWKNPTGNYVESITKNGVTIGEFTNGKNSGWMYTLNGKHPGLGVNQQTLVNGDKVVFHYSDDFTKEEGSTSDSTNGTTTGTSTGTVSGYTNYITTTATKVNTETAESVDRLIEDIGEEITLDSEAKILAARAAYDKLTEDQKKLVEKYEDLVAAEAKLAELKGASGEDVYMTTGDYIQSLGTPGVGNVGGEWMVIGLARSGRSVPSGYYDHVLSYVRANINDREQLHSAKSSDNSRLILALTAIGRDVTDVDGHDLLKGLSDMDYIQKQGINGPIWALMAFNSGNYPVPEGDVSREALINVILEAQLDDGGWALSGERSDPDMTGMAIQALAPYMESDMDVKKAVEEAIWTLSELQNDNGAFSSVDGPNSESIAQVIVALAALGIDADTDARFVKNGISALDALLTYYIPGGGFRHILDGNLDGMSTEQAYYALVAYERMKQNQKFLYDMTDVIDAGGDVILEETTEPTEAPTELVEEEEEDNGNNVVIWTGVMSICAAAIAVLLLNRKKLFGKFL